MLIRVPENSIFLEICSCWGRKTYIFKKQKTQRMKMLNDPEIQYQWVGLKMVTSLRWVGSGAEHVGEERPQPNRTCQVQTLDPWGHRHPDSPSE